MQSIFEIAALAAQSAYEADGTTFRHGTKVKGRVCGEFIVMRARQASVGLIYDCKEVGPGGGLGRGTIPFLAECIELA